MEFSIVLSSFLYKDVIIYLLNENINYGDYMRVRVGYACICNGVNVTCSSPYTYNEYLKENNLDRLDEVIISNLEALEEIIDYNIKNNIHFYRMSSKIIPLATKDDVCFDYIERYREYYDRIGNKIKDSGMRVDFHPDHFCVLNSTKKEVVDNTVKILQYHYNLLNVLGIKDKILVLHVGSSVFGQDNSIKRFINNFNQLPKYLRDVIAVENDDKVFNVQDVIKLSSIIGVPIVFDYHHHICNKSDFDFGDVFNTWKNINPKVHFSSSRNSRDFRSHSDYINSDDFIMFIESIKKYNYDIDIMIEAKKEDDSLFRLVRELKYKTDYKFVDDTTFIV